MADAVPDRPLRPFTRAQALQNAAFLRELERTGNAKLAARSADASEGVMLHRRRTRPVFAAAWEAALVVARARLDAVGGTIIGEGRIIRLRSGRVQLRRHQAPRLADATWQAFLAALSATANVALSAAAAGITKTTIYRRRHDDPGFAREMRMALEMGYQRLEAALLERYAPGSHRDDAWRHNDPPPIPPMTAAQALHLLTLHWKEVAGPVDPLRRRYKEHPEAYSLRIQLLANARDEREREKFRVAEAARRSRAGLEPDEKPVVLPALDQVTGWSRAKAEPVAPEEWTPFNGYRPPGWCEG